MQLKSRLEKLESIIKESNDTELLEERIRSMTTEELHNRLVELSYKVGEYKGFKFISPEEYLKLEKRAQEEYIDRMRVVSKEWAYEQKKQG